MDFAVTVSKREPGSAAVIGRGHVSDLKLMWVEEASVIDAVGMFIHEDPGLRRARISKLGGFAIVEIDGIPGGGSRRVSRADTNVAGETPHSVLETGASLRRTEIMIRRTLEDVFRFGDVRR